MGKLRESAPAQYGDNRGSQAKAHSHSGWKFCNRPGDGQGRGQGNAELVIASSRQASLNRTLATLPADTRVGRFNAEWVIDEFTRPHWITVQRGTVALPF